MHAIQKRPVAVDDQVVIRPMMYLALSYDHRLIDGREAVQFLVRVKECIESPERLLLEVAYAWPERVTTSIVIGAGPGGYVAAIRAAQLGHEGGLRREARQPRRHLPERRLHPQQGPARFQRAVSPGQVALHRHGIEVGDVGLDLQAMMARKDEGRQGTDRRRRLPVQEEQDHAGPRGRPPRRAAARSCVKGGRQGRRSPGSQGHPAGHRQRAGQPAGTAVRRHEHRQLDRGADASTRCPHT